MIENKPVVIRNPNAVRPWQHVLDPIVGYLSLGMYLEKQPLDFLQAYNFGPQSEDVLSVEKMFQQAITVGVQVSIKKRNYAVSHAKRG